MVTGSGFGKVRSWSLVIAPLIAAHGIPGCGGQSLNERATGGRGGDDSVGGGGAAAAGGNAGTVAATGGRAGEGGESTGASGGTDGGVGNSGGDAGGGPTGKCLNGSLELDDGNGGVECVCPAGYAGPRCEVGVRDCRADDPPCDPQTSPTGCAECRRAHIDVGPARSCLVDEDGHVTCWGGNKYLLHGGECEPSEVPTSAFEQVSTGLESCALDSSGGMNCWGICIEDCEGGDLLKPLTGQYVALSVGISFVCALDRNWELACSETPSTPIAGQFSSVTTGGWSSACVLDLERRAHCTSLVPVPSTQFRAISAGGTHVCGVRLDGRAECWGANTEGQASPPAGRFRQISSGTAHTCGVREDGTVECWGADAFTQAPSGTFVEVAAGETHSCALRPDGKVTCWGDDDYFQLHPPPELAPSAAPPVLIDVGGNAIFSDANGDCEQVGMTHGCELDSAGRIGCWGSPIGETPAGTFVDLSVGHGSACAIRDDGALVCWGNIVVDPNTTSRYSDVSAGYALACAVRTTGELDCFNYAGPMDKWRIVRDPGPPPTGTFTAVSVSGDPNFLADGGGKHAYNDPHACALDEHGRVHCWGNGQTIVVDGPFVRVSAGNTRDCALDADGVAWCFELDGTNPLVRMEGEYVDIGVGTRFYGLQANGTIAEARPYLAQTLGPVSTESFVELSVGGDFACGRRANGDVRCFGSRIR